MNEHGVTREHILAELSRSAHGKLAEYAPKFSAGAKTDPEFLAHLIAWDFTNGQIKDTKLALPVITLGERAFPEELVENSLAHLMAQPPRELVKALRFAIESRVPSFRKKKIERSIHAYLEQKQAEPGKWARLAIRHRRSLKTLYSMTRAPRPEWVGEVLFENRYVPGSIFFDVANLSKMDPDRVASAIQKWHLSPLVVSGAMTGAKAAQENSAVVQAGMEQMSDTEMVTRAASLEKKGLSRDAGLKETFRKKVSKATKSKKATLKTGVAAEEVEDESLKTMLHELQERQIAAQKESGRGIDGNWLVIADKSESQEAAIEIGKHIAAAITKFVSGRVWLAFCDNGAAGKECTGMSLEEIQAQTKFVKASGATSYGVGLAWALQGGFPLDGVVVVGDGGENTAPQFCSAHREWKRVREKDLPVYFYQTYVPPRFAMSAGGNPRLFGMSMEGHGLPVTTFDLTHGQIDYYSIPNLVQTMNASRFGVIEKIMACPLLTFEQIGLQMKKEKVCA